MKKLLVPVVILGAIVLAGCTHNDDDSRTNTGMNNTGMNSGVTNNTGNNMNEEKDFVSEAITANDMELAMLRLGQMSGSNAQMKSGIQMMITDHNALGQQLRAYAISHSFATDADDEEDRNEELQDVREDMENEKVGAEWDKEWLDKAIDMHEDMIDMFEDMEDADDQSLKAIVTAALPKLRMHRDQAKQLRDSMK